MIREEGFDVEAIAFERNYHKGKLPSCPVTKLGKIEDKKYVSRVFKMARAMPVIRRSVKQTDFVYAFGPDLAMAALMAGVGTRRGDGNPWLVSQGD